MVSGSRKLTQQASHHVEAECEKRYMVVDVATGEIRINLLLLNKTASENALNIYHLTKYISISI